MKNQAQRMELLETKSWQDIMINLVIRSFQGAAPIDPLKHDQCKRVMRTATNVMNLREAKQIEQLESSVKEIERINAELQKELDMFKPWYKYKGKKYHETLEALREGQGRREATKWCIQIVQRIKPAADELQEIVAAI